MDAFTAQYHAVISTAQLSAAWPDVIFDVRVITEARADDRHWVIVVQWQDGPVRSEVAEVLGGPPAGVHLERGIGIPELYPDGQTEH